MVSADMQTHSILGSSCLATVRTGISNWAVIEMFGLQVAEHSVPARCNKRTERTGEQFPVLVPQDVGHDLLLPGSCWLCNNGGSQVWNRSGVWTLASNFLIISQRTFEV